MGIGGVLSLLWFQRREDTSDAHVLSEHLCDGDPGVQELLAPLVTDAGHEAGWLPDQSKLPGPVVVHGDRRWRYLRLGYDCPGLDQLGVHVTDFLPKLIE